MPVSVQTPEDPNPLTLPSPRRHALRPGLRVAAVLAAIGGMTSAASGQDTFDGGAGDNTDFNDALNWLGDVDPGTNLGGETIVFDFDDPSIDPFTILVTQDIFQIGDLDNTADGVDIIFDGSGGGSFEFISGAVIDPGDGSFTFDLDVTALGDLTFELANGSAIFNESFTANGGIITANGGDVVFNGAVSSGAGTSWVSADGGFIFNDAFTYAADLVFDLNGGGQATFNAAFTATGGTITADGGTITFNDAVTSTLDTTWTGIGGGFSFNDSFDSVGDVTFDLDGNGGDSGSATFGSTVVFGEDGGAAAMAEFSGGTATFVGDVTAHADYDFTFGSGIDAAFGGDVDFLGDHELIFDGGAAASLDELSQASFAGTVGFVDGATLTISGDNYDDFSDPDDTVSNLTFAGIDFAGDFNLLMDGQQYITFGGAMTFLDSEDAADPTTFSVAGSNTDGDLTLSGASTMAGAFRLLVTGGQTVNWRGASEFGGDFTLDTRGGGNAEVNFGSPTGGFSIASGIDEVNMFILTDGGTDEVSLNGRAFRNGTFNLMIGSEDVDGTATNQSTLTMSGGTISGAQNLEVNLNLFADSTLNLQSLDPESAGLAQVNEWAFNSINDGDVDSGTMNLAGGFDGTVFLRGGEFSGDFTQENNGEFNLAWTLNESRFTGTADIKGSYATRNNGIHRLGDADGDRAKIGYTTAGAASDGISALEIIQGTMYVENADILTAADGGLNMISGATAAAMLVIENDSMVDIKGDFSMSEAASMLMITGDSSSAVNLTIGGISTINGMVEVSGTSGNGNANADFQGDATLGGMITQSNSSKVNFGGNLAMSTGSMWLLEDTSTADVAGNLDMESGSALSLDDGTALAVTGDITSAGQTTIEEGARLSGDNLVLNDGAIMALIDNSLEDDNKVLLDLAGGLNIESGATLYGSGEIQLGDEFVLEDGGTLISGVEGSAEGVLEISGGDLKLESGSTVRLGVNSEIAEDAAAGIGNSSIIKVDQTVIFESGASVAVDVQQGAYIPTAPSQMLEGSLEFVLLEAADFSNYNDDYVQAGAPSVTRNWQFDRDQSGGMEQILASSTADYTNTLSGSQLAIGELLNGFREPANLAPEGEYGILLGQLDGIQTASAYQAAILGFEPTSQITAIQTAALSQYHDVLRNEIRRRFTLVERRTPAPFRLGAPYELAGQEEVVERSIRRQVRSNPTAESFGAFWTRDLRTPSQGDIVGFDGNEYGGLGGFGWRLSDNWTVGVDVGYSAFVGNLNGGYGDTRVGTLRGGGFVTWGSGDGLFFDAALSGGWNNFNFNRAVPGTTLGNTSNADGFQIDGTFGTGYRMALSEGLALTPNGSFLYSYINTGNIDEQYTGGSTAAALAITPGDLSSFIGRIGADLSWSALPGLVIDGQLGWQGNFTDNGSYTVGLVGTSTNVPVDVRNQTLNTAYYGVGVNWNVAEQIDLNLRWEGRSGDGVNSQMFTGGVTISF